MTKLIIIAIIAGGGFGLLFAYINEMMKKDNRIAELEYALVEAYTEIEFAKLGLMK
jgi:hypothetical protein